MIRVALVGNLNNNFSAIMKWLRTRGFDAHLYYNATPHYFHASADTLNKEYLEFCHEVDWVKQGFKPQNLDKPAIQLLFKSFDKIIAQGNEAAVLNYCGIPIDIYFPYGTDISKYAHLPHHYNLYDRFRLATRKNSGFNWSLSGQGTFSKYLFNSIRTARYVFMDASNPEFEATLKQIPLQGKFEYVPMPFIYYPEYDTAFKAYTSPPIHWANNMQELRSENDFIVLYHGRQFWKSGEKRFASKANDVLIKGFASFLNGIQNGIRAHLILLNFGPDVTHSKELINALGISDHVTWFPQMYRKDIMYLISQSDVGAGEFGKSYLTFGTIIENMVQGKPVLHYRDDSLYKQVYPWLYPLLNVKTPKDVASSLLYYYSKKDELRAIGDKARQWVLEFFIERPLGRIIEILND